MLGGGVLEASGAMCSAPSAARALCIGEKTRKKVGKRNENFQNEGSSLHTRRCRQVQTLGKDCRQSDLEGNERRPLRSRQTLLML